MIALVGLAGVAVRAEVQALSLEELAPVLARAPLTPREQLRAPQILTCHSQLCSPS